MASYVITGATRGIGRCVLDALGDKHEITAIGRSAPALAALPVAHRVVADLWDPAGLAAAFDALPERLDGLVHCAGVAVRGDLADSSVAEWNRELAINVVSAAELTRLLLPALRAARGTVVFVNSGQGRRATANSTVYAATKFALRAVADTLREEEPDLRVSTVYPGRVATDMQQALRAQEGGAYEPDSYLAAETVAAAVVSVLGSPPDSVVTDLILRPRSR
ncbi:MAG: SDR family oxidoreductase [bacterium]